ncbi:TAL effector repeat-containing protein [Legionella yabuuchiae]|uniref:TAL effector repeat-containing protein n=1 Tax=Legionella yabuuchiae TaxID=376727 RepID=UPI00105477D0|nr:TAL effector repeat-containing protein [Legionella yabuuchiae]
MIKQKCGPSDVEQLVKAGFTLVQANKFIKKKLPSAVANVVLANYASLTKMITGWELDINETIVRVAARSGGEKNIEMLLEHEKTLRDWHFTGEQILKIVAHDGGSKNLNAVLLHFKALRALKFNCKDIVKIVGHGGGSKNLNAVLAHSEALCALQFQVEDIVKILAHQGGSKNLNAVLAHSEALLALQFTGQDILKMVGHDGGSKNLNAVLEHFEALRALQFTGEDIVKIVGHIGGSKNLGAVLVNFKTLRDLQFTSKDIVKIVGHIGGSKNIEEIVQHERLLLSLGLTGEALLGVNGIQRGQILNRLIERKSSEQSGDQLVAPYLDLLNQQPEDELSWLEGFLATGIPTVDFLMDTTQDILPSILDSDPAGPDPFQGLSSGVGASFRFFTSPDPLSNRPEPAAKRRCPANNC